MLLIILPPIRGENETSFPAALTPTWPTRDCRRRKSHWPRNFARATQTTRPSAATSNQRFHRQLAWQSPIKSQKLHLVSHAPESDRSDVNRIVLFIGSIVSSRKPRYDPISDRNAPVRSGNGFTHLFFPKDGAAIASQTANAHVENGCLTIPGLRLYDRHHQMRRRRRTHSRRPTEASNRYSSRNSKCEKPATKISGKVCQFELGS